MNPCYNQVSYFKAQGYYYFFFGGGVWVGWLNLNIFALLYKNSETLKNFLNFPPFHLYPHKFVFENFLRLSIPKSFGKKQFKFCVFESQRTYMKIRNFPAKNRYAYVFTIVFVKKYELFSYLCFFLAFLFVSYS